MRCLYPTETSALVNILLIFITGRGQKSGMVLTFEGCLMLIDLLPSSDAIDETKAAMRSIITRYMAGDTSMIRELKRNAVSTNPINVLARDSKVVLEKGIEGDGSGSKRALEDEDIGSSGTELVKFQKMIAGAVEPVFSRSFTPFKDDIIAGLEAEKAFLRKELADLKESHQKEIKKIHEEHAKKLREMLTQQKDKLLGRMLPINEVYKKYFDVDMPSSQQLMDTRSAVLKNFLDNMKEDPEIDTHFSTNGEYEARCYYQRDYYLIVHTIESMNSAEGKSVDQQVADLRAECEAIKAARLQDSKKVAEGMQARLKGIQQAYLGSDDFDLGKIVQHMNPEWKRDPVELMRIGEHVAKVLKEKLGFDCGTKQQMFDGKSVTVCKFFQRDLFTVRAAISDYFVEQTMNASYEKGADDLEGINLDQLENDA